MEIFGKILGLLLLTFAVYLLDSTGWKDTIISTVFLLAGLSLLFQDAKSEINNRFSKLLGKAAFALSVLFFVVNFIAG